MYVFSTIISILWLMIILISYNFERSQSKSVHNLVHIFCQPHVFSRVKFSSSFSIWNVAHGHITNKNWRVYRFCNHKEIQISPLILNFVHLHWAEPSPCTCSQCVYCEPSWWTPQSRRSSRPPGCSTGSTSIKLLNGASSQNYILSMLLLMKRW